MSELLTVQADALSEAPSTQGISRAIALEGEGFRIVRARTHPGTISGWHHHGNHDVYGFVVSGTVRFEYGPGGTDSSAVGPGDFFHVPQQTVHRDVNPSSDEGQEVILFLRGTGPLVVNVDGPDQRL